MPNLYNRYGGGAAALASGAVNALDAGPSVTFGSNVSGSVQVTGVLLLAALVLVVLIARSLGGAV
jgi:hypothetical protein